MYLSRENLSIKQELLGEKCMSFLRNEPLLLALVTPERPPYEKSTTLPIATDVP